MRVQVGMRCSGSPPVPSASPLKSMSAHARSRAKSQYFRQDRSVPYSMGTFLVVDRHGSRRHAHLEPAACLETTSAKTIALLALLPEPEGPEVRPSLKRSAPGPCW